ncbi:hypothetical protein FRC12_003880 [Ceratobasidium sp. 428]|nr:hypothetical protein FRC12_003880 [Ceratobasidium sp. 428]
MDPTSPNDSTDLLRALQQLTERIVSEPSDAATTSALVLLLQDLGTSLLDVGQRTQIGANPTFSECVSQLWAIEGSRTKVEELRVELVRALTRLTRNVTAGSPDNQLWVAKRCEPSLRKLLHFLTSFYNSQVIEYHGLTTLLAQCLANTITGNEITSTMIWTEYMDLVEQDNILTRLLAYPEQKSVTATLVFALNSSTSSPQLIPVIAERVGGRATYIALLEIADRTYEDEDRADQFQLIFQIFVKLFEHGGLSPLYTSLQPSDGTISPHQITLLKLLDGYTQSADYTVNTAPLINDFLTRTLLSLLRTSNTWMNADLVNGQPNENLPQAATAIVLVSQMLSNGLMAEQIAWEKLIDNGPRGRPILENLSSAESSYVELIIDVLRQLDQLLPRIQFGKVRPQFPNTSSPNELVSPDVSGFQFVKRDLIRLLGTVVHDDKSIQDRIRERGGIQVVLSLCAVDDRNPYIREHALFTLRNLLHNNKENQDVVRELEPMGRWDENGVLTNYH